MKKKILIISGGISKERVISLDTGRQVKKELIKNGYNVKITEPDYKLLEVIKLFKPSIIDMLEEVIRQVNRLNYYLRQKYSK